MEGAEHLRYIPINNLRAGAALAYPVFSQNSDILLGEGMMLSKSHISRLTDLGYAGVYIQDELSADIKLEDIVPISVRLHSIASAKEIWKKAESGIRVRVNDKTIREKQDNLIIPVIDSLIKNPKRMVELINLNPESEYIYYHASNVMILSLLLGVELGLSGIQLYELGISSLLFDIGTVFLPPGLLDKPGKLTEDEYKDVKKHTQLGFDYLRETFNISIEGCMGAFHHHESFDGSGYPNGLKGSQISIYGRILAIADVYDALTSRRPFRRMLYPPAAMHYMNSQSGKLFDPPILQAFQRVVPFYPSGFCVELSNGEKGIVVQNYVGTPDLPRIRLFGDSQPKYADLRTDDKYHRITVNRIIEM